MLFGFYYEYISSTDIFLVEIWISVFSYFKNVWLAIKICDIWNNG